MTVKTANENVIRALARAMAAARAGNIEAVAVIAATPEGVPDVSFAGEADLMPSINVGADMLKSYVIAQCMAPLQQKVTPLVRAVGGLDS